MRNGDSANNSHSAFEDHMLVHFGKTYTATAKGSRVYSAKCEKCGQVYFYEQMLVASGSGTSPYFLNNLGAEDRAHASAQRALAREMKHGVDAVPCPKCHWVQDTWSGHWETLDIPASSRWR